MAPSAQARAPEDMYVAKAQAIWDRSKEVDDECIKYLDQAIKINPRRADLYLLKADWLWRLEGDDKAGLEAANLAHKISPKSAHALLMMALFLSRSGKREEAIKSVDQSIVLDKGNNPDSLLLKAKFLEQDGDLARAETTLSQAIKAHPNGLDEPLRRAQVRLKLKDYKGALEDADFLLAHSEERHILIKRKAYEMRAEAHRGMHDVVQTKRDYAELLKKCANDRTALLYAQKYYEETGDVKSVTAIKERVNKLDEEFIPPATR